MVRTYSGEVLDRSENRALNRLFDSAAARGLLLMGHVDPYDDTVFNQLQVRLISLELKALIPFLTPDEAIAAREVGNLAELVSERPHRYLVINGD